jgi:integrase
MAKKRTRIYWRDRGAERRFYGDFRDFADVGGGREALVPKGATMATTDPLIAEKLASDRVAELVEQRRGKTILGIERQARLEEFAAHHLIAKAQAGRVTESWLAGTEQRLRVAVEYFGAERDIFTISVRDVELFAHWLGQQGGGKRGRKTLGPQTVRHYLNALSNLYRRAQGEGCVPPGFNPVAAMMEKPVPRAGEAEWLEVHDAAALLEAARTYRHRRDRRPSIPCIYPIIATYLLTGGREKEVLGLEVEDISFDRKTVTFRPNAHRRLKTATSHRTVPLWPQLEEILRDHLYGGESPRVSGLLFPSPRSETPAMIRDLRKALDQVAERAGWKTGEIRTKAFRHTYCAARLQTLDRGAPVSVYTVAKELGHGGDSLVKRVYGHLGQVRQRVEILYYNMLTAQPIEPAY